MTNKYAIIIALIILLPFFIALSGGDVKYDIGKINALLLSENVSYDLEYIVFSAGDNSTHIENGVYMKQGRKIYIRQAGVEKMVNENFLVIADHNNRNLFIMDPVNYEKEFSFSMQYFDLVMKEGVETETLIRGENRTHIFHFSNNRLSKMEVDFDKNSYRLNFIRLEMATTGDKQPDTLTIRFTRRPSSANEGLFNTGKFFIMRNGEVIPGREFKEYDLFNSMVKENFNN